MRIALLTHPTATKGVRIARALAAVGIAPSLLILQLHKRSGARRLAGRRPAGCVIDHARAHAIATVAGDLTDRALLDELARREIDLFVLAGAGILRAPLLAIPRLGTLNAHMGLLPEYRGFNVTEWAALSGGAVGCTVHLVDSGIDTGAILASRTVDPSGATSIAALRDRVDAAQHALLVETVADIAARGALPPTRPQAKADGRQYFRMHPALRAILERRLAAR